MTTTRTILVNKVTHKITLHQENPYTRVSTTHLNINKIVTINKNNTPQGPTRVGTGNGTPELPSAWGYSWATLSPGVINTERSNAGEGQQQIYCIELKQFR
jgi:hypothetical protein